MADESKELNAGESYDLVASLISILEQQDGQALLQAIAEAGIGVDLADPLAELGIGPLRRVDLKL